MNFENFETTPEQLYYLSQQQDQYNPLLRQSLIFSGWKHTVKRRLSKAQSVIIIYTDGMPHVICDMI